MLFTIIGNDFEKKSKKIKETIAGLKKKKPDAIFRHYDFLDLNEEKIKESIETVGGLFEEKNIFLFSNIFYNKKLKKIFWENLDKISESDNAFILTENTLTEAEFLTLKKKSYKAENFVLAKNSFNIFSISNAVQNKDKKKLWLNYHLALKNELIPEIIFGNIFFGIKSLVLTEKFSNKESGLKPFTYKQATLALKKWKKNEAEKKMFQLISIYTQSRISGLSLSDNLEKFILEL